ncbi:hypothetical protein CPB86DRAFT_782775 [Serendipita vermifera]|nr:hypothetical protein CPB86DRAFT_782775 [Serendipita vermifera]
MLDVPQGKQNLHGTDEKPVTLVGDSVEGWEIFLGLLYPDNPVEPLDVYLLTRLDAVFPILIKYSADTMEKSIIRHLEASQDIHNIVSLVMVSKILGSDQLYKKARDALIEHSEQIGPDDARRIDSVALYDVVIGRYNKLAEKAHSCRNCRSNSFKCRNCGAYQ